MGRASIVKRGGCPLEQQTLGLELEDIKQSNSACQGEWIIPPMAQCLVYLMAMQYQKLYDIEPFTEFKYIRTKVKDILGFYGQSKKRDESEEYEGKPKKGRPGGNQQRKAEDLINHITDGHILLTYENGDKEAAAIFSGHSYYYADTQEILACFNNDMHKVYTKLGKDYTWLNLIEMCRLPNDKYCRKVYQFVKSYKFKGQAVVSFEKFSKAVGSPYEKFKDFNRFILAPAKEDIEACTTLRFKYEKVAGPHGKTTEIRIWFPAMQEAIEAKNIALAEHYLAEKAAKQANSPDFTPDAPTNFTAKVPGTFIKRPSAHIILVSGMIDYCNKWIKAHNGRWAGKKGGKYLVFEYPADADYFVEICQENGIPLKQKKTAE